MMRSIQIMTFVLQRLGQMWSLSATGLLLALVLVLVVLIDQAPDAGAFDYQDGIAAPTTGEFRNAEYVTYLPVAVGPPPLIVADFSTCNSTNNLGGMMGAAYNPPSNVVIETYSETAETPGNCVARIEYHIKDWGAFWLQFEPVDLSDFSILMFDVRGDGSIGIPKRVKIEIKSDCRKVGGGNQCDTVVINSLTDISEEWQRRVAIELSAFIPLALTGETRIEDWSNVEELVFTFEASSSGEDGAIYLDNVLLGN